MKHLFILLISAMLISACNSVPKRLSVAEDVKLTSYEQANTQTTASHNKQARWGGRIISITNQAQNTVLDVLHQELNNSGRPKTADKSQGRFRVYMQGYLEPAIYEPGRMITVLGKLAEHEQALVGSYPVSLPVIHASQMHLWQQRQVKEKEFVYIPYIVHRPIYIQSK